MIHPLAQVCSKESRWNILSPCLIQLLQDQSRWVKTAALRVLGYFISTFARTNENDEQINKDESKSNDQIDSLCSNLQENVQLTTNEKFNDFNYWREPLLMDINFDEIIRSSLNQCKK